MTELLALVQDVSQEPGTLLPANLAMQIVQTTITAGVGFALPLLLRRARQQISRQIAEAA